MVMSSLSLNTNYWESFDIQDHDLEFLYSHLLDIETPQTSLELLHALITERIRREKENLRTQQKDLGAIYLPKGTYQVGQQIQFPALNWKVGKIAAIRTGKNPDLPPFDVLDVIFENGENKKFAATLETHILNQPIDIRLDDPLLDEKHILRNFGQQLQDKLTEYLDRSPDLVRIAGKWFPRALLVDVNIGHLNLAEAVLDMEGGGPMPTHEILEQIELPTDSNSKLTEFSMNLALQEDGRFDEIGPAGETLWYLRRLEPEWVQNSPPYLKGVSLAYDREKVIDLIGVFQRDVVDELDPEDAPKEDISEIAVTLIYPHWLCGTLPLTNRVRKLFPSAYESPRVRFTFIDNETRQKISGWVVRSSHYVIGLRDWFVGQGLMPGSIVHIRRSKIPGEVLVWAEKRRPAREWIRTALVGSDGGVVFAMLKQLVVAGYDERMAIAVPDLKAITELWDAGSKSRVSIELLIQTIMRDLAKLNPQGHVHAHELYAAINLTRRCSPGMLLGVLADRPWSKHLGDLYFRPENPGEETGPE
jgi:hypothetical protein